MNVPIQRIKTSLLFAISLLAISSSLAESPDKVTRTVISDIDILRDAPAHSEMSFSVIVFRDVGWTEAEVKRVVREASQIYARECRLTLAVQIIRFTKVDEQLHRLDQDLQEQLLAELDDTQRPIVFFIGTTSEADFAYAYMEGTVSPSQGTAWLTRKSTKECRGPLLAHELGHIALEASKHSNLPDNLMSDSCRHSNIINQSINTDLIPKQCETLWRRYRQD